MSAISVANVVVFPERLGDFGADGLLSVAQMGRSVNKALKITALDLFFELPNQGHRPIEADSVLDAQCCGGLVARAPGSWRRLGHRASLPGSVSFGCYTRYFRIVSASSSNPNPAPEGTS